MRRNLTIVALIGLLLAPAAAQQTALTDGQIQAAEIEVPELAKLLNLKPGMTVADVGAGFGAWTVRFAKFVGPAGRVYATDIGAAQLASLRDYTAREGLKNVTVIEGAPDSTNLPAQCCDAILIRDAYHHLTQPAPILASMTAALKPGGRLVVIDFPPRPNSEVPSGVPGESRRTRSAAGSRREGSGRLADPRADHSELDAEKSASFAVPGAVSQILTGRAGRYREATRRASTVPDDCAAVLENRPRNVPSSSSSRTNFPSVVRRVPSSVKTSVRRSPSIVPATRIGVCAREPRPSPFSVTFRPEPRTRLPDCSRLIS